MTVGSHGKTKGETSGEHRDRKTCTPPACAAQRAVHPEDNGQEPCLLLDGHHHQKGDPPPCVQPATASAGKLTVMLFGGNGNAWDGSSNFCFMKELMRRYVGGEGLGDDW